MTDGLNALRFEPPSKSIRAVRAGA